MKNFIVILIMITGSFFIGCFGDGDEFSSANLNYENNDDSGTEFTEIRWTVNGAENQNWSGETLSALGDTTTTKAVTEETGLSECIAGGNPAILEYDTGAGPGQALTLSDGATHTFVIESYTKK
jgi:hypothetical protein